ncbi:hypothetical protein [Brassicibacter mesophilus]|uniref:hypothetical protein n=1 Tax=Brassicibacter mesophilus TaxID=745119 RepID=UPI003D1BE9F4
MDNELYSKLKDLYCDTYDEIIQDIDNRIEKKVVERIDRIEGSLSELIDVLKDIVK